MTDDGCILNMAVSGADDVLLHYEKVINSKIVVKFIVEFLKVLLHSRC